MSGPSRSVDVTPHEKRADTNPYFLDVAPGAGLATVLHGGGERKDHLLESVGTGAAFIDFDEDGRLDVFLVNAWALDEEPSRVRLKGRNALYPAPGWGSRRSPTRSSSGAVRSSTTISTAMWTS